MIVENARDICAIKDLDLRVIVANMAFVQAAKKRSFAELIGRTGAEIVSGPPVWTADNPSHIAAHARE